VERREKEFRESDTAAEALHKRTADIFEAIILKEAELSEWLGTATTYKTAAYDDYYNKIDMIAEWGGEGEANKVIALGTDVTYGALNVHHKLERIREAIDRGQLGTIKYFKDAAGNFMGRRKNVPLAVIGVSLPAVQELASLWMNGEKKQLGAHPIQRVLTEQLQEQLIAMEQYALAIGQFAPAAAIRQTLGTIEPIAQEKRTIPLQGLEHDSVWKELRASTKVLFATR
jgi:hypothetical protein